jgi:hypothetical protein
MFSCCTHPSLIGANLLCRFNNDHVFIVGQGKTNGGRMTFLTCHEEFIEILEEIGDHDVVMERFWEAYESYHIYLSRSRRPYEVELDDGISEFLKQHVN